LTAVRCPICKKPVSDDPPADGAKNYFPFCSERCKLIDLGRWLEGRYQIPVADDDPASRERESHADDE
jgi:endogenous inhibitor of DNA gyrase (YacG/DUF329 family)